MCENCVAIGLMTQEEADAQASAFDSDGPLVTEFMGNGGGMSSIGDILSGQTAQEMLMVALMGDPEKAAIVVAKLSTLMERAGWSGALIRNIDSGALAMGWSRNGATLSIPVFILPDEIADRLNDI